MIAVLSPAKKLDFSCHSMTLPDTEPLFLNGTKILMERLKTMTAEDLSSLMGISDKLGNLNFERYQSFSYSAAPENAKQAILAFRGDTYVGLEADSLDTDDMEFAQEHLRILSGLYGMLRVCDMIQPYRLDMGTTLANPAGDNLYAFWSNTLSEALHDTLAKHKENVLINLASAEYFRVINRDMLEGRIINIVFKETRNGVSKTIGLLAKRARGMMARFIVKHRINTPDNLKNFTEGGYRFMPEVSSQNKWVFIR